MPISKSCYYLIENRCSLESWQSSMNIENTTPQWRTIIDKSHYSDKTQSFRAFIHTELDHRLSILSQTLQADIECIYAAAISYILFYYLENDTILLTQSTSGKQLSTHCLSINHEISFIDWLTEQPIAKKIESGHKPANIVIAFHRNNQSVDESVDFYVHLSCIDDLILNYHFKSSIFNQTYIQQFHALLLRFLNWLSPHWNQPLSSFEWMSEETKAQITAFEDKNQRTFPQTGIISWLKKHAIATPQQTALRFAGDALDYQTLDSQTDDLALTLQAWIQSHAIAKRNQGLKIAVCYPAGFDEIKIIISILKINACFIPLNPKAPNAYLASVLTDAKADFVLVDKRWKKELQTNISIPCVSIENLIDGPNPLTPFVYQSPAPLDPIYILYTSGSTGQPKGICIHHQNVCNIIYGIADQINLKDCRQILGITKSYFDPFIFDFFSAILHGCTYIIVADCVRINPQQLAGMIEEEQPDFIFATPTLWRELIDYLQPQKKIRIMASGAERLDSSLAQVLQGFCCELWNFFGPTETSIYCSLAQIKDKQVDIGRPFPNYTMFVANQYGQLLPPGVAGELYIGGPGLGRYISPHVQNEHYFNTFINNPNYLKNTTFYKSGDHVVQQQNGRFQFLGRLDDQLKIRGQRVCPQMIENILLKQRPVKEVLVIPFKQGTQLKLAAYVRLQPPWSKFSKWTLIKKKIRQLLLTEIKNKLPEAMHLAKVVFVNTLPQTSNGKLDRNTLLAQTLNQPLFSHQIIDGNNAQVLELIWQHVLNQKINLNADFFALGGNSIQALHLLAEINKRFNLHLPATWVYQYPRFQQQINSIEKSKPQQNFQALTTLRCIGQTKPTLILFHPSLAGAEIYNHLIKRMHANLNIIGVNPFNLYSQKPMIQTLDKLLDYYTHEIINQSLQGPVYLGGWSFGAVLAIETARRLQERLNIHELFIFDCLDVDKNVNFLLQFFLRYRWFYRFIDFANYDVLPDFFYQRMRLAISQDFKMLQNYQLKPIDLPIQYFRAAKDSFLARVSANYQQCAYRCFSEQMSLHHIQADHFELLLPPFVDEIAERLNMYLGKTA